MANPQSQNLQPGVHIKGASFAYPEALDVQTIRLLDLKYGHGNEVIHFHLRKYSLDTHPDYIALSYTWGDPSDPVPVLCDGKIMNVTRNLKGALWQLRENCKGLARRDSPRKSSAQPLYYWIDAICINQSDEIEKSCQVGLMADIYQRAYKTIVWLGLADDNSDMVLDYMNKLGAKAESCHMDMGPGPYRGIWLDMARTTPANQRLSQPGITITDAEGNITREHWRKLQSLFHSISGWHSQGDLLPVAGVKRFFTRSWWGRIWVLQEG